MTVKQLQVHRPVSILERVYLAYSTHSEATVPFGRKRHQIVMVKQEQVVFTAAKENVDTSQTFDVFDSSLQCELSEQITAKWVG